MFLKHAVYRVRVDDWLYLTSDGRLSYHLKDAHEFNDLREVYNKACEIPHTNVIIIKNKRGKVEFINLERLHMEGDSHWK